jgi:glucose/arabinose dehydrogenase
MKSLCAICVLALLCASPAHAQLQGQIYASGFQTPVAFVQDPTDRSVQFVVQQTGRIRVVRNGTVLGTDFLDLTSAIACCGEQGLLGLAFAPDYASSGRFFVNFTNSAGDTVVARFRRSTEPVVADAASRADLTFLGRRIIEQPFANHNGGHLVFGPDGYLYIGLGDGGSGNDPGNRAQNPNELLGKMLRIDVNVPGSDPIGYTIPPDNPFVGRAGLDEIWAFGLRNPWRYSFDDPARGGTGALVIGDVGQNRFEEIDYEPRGAGGRNYGWRNREGAHDNVTSQQPAFQPLIDPIFEYGRSDGVSVTGGFVYRGSRLGSSYRGRYFFADYSGRVWSLALSVDEAGEARASDRREHTAELGGSSVLGSISSFGVDADGELYIVNHSGGRIVRIAAPLSAPPAPTELKILKP